MNHPDTQIAAVLLAAGKGTRMKSALPKVLHKAAGRALIEYPLKALKQAGVARVVIVDNIDQAIQKSGIEISSSVSFATQDPPLGTGHAVLQAMPALKDFKGQVLIAYGDVPLIRTQTLARLVGDHQDAKAVLTLATATLDHYPPYGRLVRSASGQPLRIVEAKDVSETERKINEFNVGLYLVDAGFLKKALAKLSTSNQQKEYYLTDLVALAAQENQKIHTINILDEVEWQGVNTQADLTRIEEEIFNRRRLYWQLEGVKMSRRDQIQLDDTVELASDVSLEGPLSLTGNCTIGSGVRIEMGCVIDNSNIASGARILAHTYIESSEIGADSVVGPFAHLRPGSILGKNVKVGNFVELKKTTLGEGAKASHLSYLGDATIGKNANIGCGTITCNYDGYNKFQTIIKEGVFIGSDTQLVAPVTIGSHAFVGAGSTITKDVSEGALVVSRVAQKEIVGWVDKFKSKQKKNHKPKS